MKFKFIKLLTTFILCYSLISCGNKGDLYMPKKPDVTQEDIKMSDN